MRRAPLALAAVLCCAARPKEPAIVWIEATAPSTLHPLWAASTLDLRAQAPIYDRLVPAGSKAGPLATEVTVEEGKVTVSLRRDVRWHDGAKLTGADVCATVDALRDKQAPTPLGGLLGPLLQHCAPLPSDPSTVVIHLAEHPSADPLRALDFPVLPAHLAPFTAPDHALATRPVGTGAWQAEPADGEVRYTPSKNPHVPADLPALVLRVDRDAPTDRKLHGIAGWPVVPTDQVERLRTGEGWALTPYPLDVVLVLALDLTEPPLSDPALRQALDAAIDRGALCRDLVGSWADASTPACRPTASPFARSTGATNHGVELPEPAPLPAQPQLTLTLAIPAELELDPEALGSWLGRALAPHQVKTEVLSLASLLALDPMERRKRFDGVVYARMPADADLRPDLGMTGRRNWFAATNPAILAALSGSSREELWDLHALVADERPILPLVELSAMSAWSDAIQPLWMTPTDGLGAIARWGLSAAPPDPRRRR